MVSVQHPAAAAAFWPAPTHNHVFAFPASAQCGSLVPQWHLPSATGSCVSVSSHALAGQHRRYHNHHHQTPVTASIEFGEGLGSLGQALASSAAAFLTQPPPLAPGPPLPQVLVNPQTFVSPVVPLPVPQAIATLDPEQPIGYGSFGVVWYAMKKYFLL